MADTVVEVAAPHWLSALDLLSQGFIVLDADARIVTCNRRFVDMRELPQGLCRPGRPFADLVHRMAARGEFGPGPVDAIVAGQMAPIVQRRHEDFHRRMSDGGVLHVTVHPLPDGGTLVTYEDVTALRQREIEVEQARAATERTLHELQALLDTIEYGILFLDADLTIRVANRAYRELWGFPPDFHDRHPSLREDMELAQSLGRYATPDDGWEAYLAARFDAIRAGAIAPTEIDLSDGRTLRYQCVSLPDGGRMLTYFDVTEMKRREQELASKSAILQATLDHMAQGITMVDASRNVVALNHRLNELLDLPPDRFGLGFNLVDAWRYNAARGEYGPGDVEELVRERLAWPPLTEPQVTERTRPDGTVIQIHASPLPDGSYVTTYADITPQRRAEAALREANERLEQKVAERTAALEHASELLRNMTDDAPVMLVLSDEGDDVIFANARFLDFCGRTLDQVRGRGWQDSIHPDDRAAALAAFGEGFHGRQLHEVEYRMRRADGEYRWVRDVNVPRHGLEGGFAGFVSAMEDVTERKAIEAELVQQREALHHSEKLAALGSLLAGVAHELNNPLSVVLAQATLLQETATDEKVIARGQKIKAPAERCAKIVRTFLAMARRRPPERVAVDLNDTVEAALEVLAYGLRSDGVTVLRDLAPDLPLTSADGDQLHQVVVNLLLNAQQAMTGSGSETRQLRVATRFDSVRGRIELTVDDSGPGIAPELRGRIFEPFFTTKPAGYGTGVGLSLCHGIVDSHGGRIAVAQADLGGARFTVTLPYVPTETAARPSAATPAAIAAARRILIVDDEAEVAATCAELLSAVGYRCETAGNGREALDRLAVRGFDLILSDMRMPVLDGAGFYHELLRRDPAAAARVLFVTGDSLSPSAQSFLAGLRRPAIEKPFDAGQLRATVAAALSAADARG